MNYKLNKIIKPMNIFKTVLSIGAGILATAASYLLMSSNKKENTVNNNVDDDGFQRSPQIVNSEKINKSNEVLMKIDRLQVGLMNFARFSGEILRAVSLFIRAMNCYEYDSRYQQNR